MNRTRGQRQRNRSPSKLIWNKTWRKNQQLQNRTW
jgi:hypothetical protein